MTRFADHNRSSSAGRNGHRADSVRIDEAITDSGDVPSEMVISNSVRAFYESHPYPPPVKNLDGYGKLWDYQRRRAELILFWPSQRYREERTILIAGCGTSQAAKYAMRWPRAKVVGIDVSASSVAFTQQLKRKYRLDNLEVRQLAVEDVAELGQRFELIVSTGVLHHLPNPDAGLRALHSVLAPRGALHLMVYAPYGRAGVYLIQDYCRRLGIGTSEDDIRQLSLSLRALPLDHPLMPLIRNSPDFQSEAGLADALLHPKDRAYSVPELFDFLDVGGFRFGRWVRQASYLPQCGALRLTPHYERLSRLPILDQYSAVELFRGTMVRHSIVAYSKECDEPQVSFRGSGWGKYVPVRLPNTIAVHERLPEGAAAVLINQSHSFTDLYLPITAVQESLLVRIDGRRSIAEITNGIAPLGEAHQFFEQLWFYDQIVFDASHALNNI